jgi:hypothetical protein
VIENQARPSVAIDGNVCRDEGPVPGEDVQMSGSEADHVAEWARDLWLVCGALCGAPEAE